MRKIMTSRRLLRSKKTIVAKAHPDVAKKPFTFLIRNKIRMIPYSKCPMTAATRPRARVKNLSPRLRKARRVDLEKRRLSDRILWPSTRNWPYWKRGARPLRIWSVNAPSRSVLRCTVSASPQVASATRNASVGTAPILQRMRIGFKQPGATFGIGIRTRSSPRSNTLAPTNYSHRNRAKWKIPRTVGA